MKPKAYWNPQKTLDFYNVLARETRGMETFYLAFGNLLSLLFESRVGVLQDLYVGTSHSTLCISGTPAESTAIPGVTLKISPDFSVHRPARIELDYRYNVGNVLHALTHTVQPLTGEFLAQFDDLFREFKEFRAAVGKKGAIAFKVE